MLWKGPRRLVACIDWLGLPRLVFKSDQRFSLSKKQSEQRCRISTMEESPVDVIEVTVREMQKRSRVVRSALQERLTSEVLSRHPIWASLYELLSKYQVGRERVHSCMLVSRTANSLLNFGKGCTSCQSVLQVHDTQNGIPSGMMVHAFEPETAVMKC